MAATIADAANVLKSTFGFPGFRAGQEPVISRLLGGESAVAIFPTGAGKSLCYQLPALMMEGTTLVVSPLIALMKDQIDFLTSHGVAAARLDSSVDAAEFRRVHDELNSGRLKILYVAPERFGSERFLQTLKRLRLSMMAVDEAHCISEWGHNFRPDYLKLARLAKELNVGRVLALTATATPDVAGQIAKAFGIGEEGVVRTGFYRPNLELRVTPADGDRVPLLLDRIRSRPAGATIVYVTLQKTAEGVAEALCAKGIEAKAYHAGLNPEVRHGVQDWFMDDGSPVVVATIAFGMGIDKSDLRYVYHYNLPKSLENYAQEIGRAGRDGKPAVCEVLASGEDLITLENFTFGDTPTADAVAGMLDEVLGAGEVFDLSVYDLSGAHDIRPLVVETVLTYLELMGILRATGPFYNEYKFQPTKSSAEILAKFEGERRDFLKQILARAEKGKTWFKLDLQRVQRETGFERQRIVSAVNYLEEQGDLVVQVAGLRQGYRRGKEEGDRAALAAKLAGRFVERERRDVERLGKVLDFAGHDGCRWRYLAGYFGEERAGGCGHCDHCLGQHGGHIAEPKGRAPGERMGAAVRGLMAEYPEALGEPRQVARFLAGLNSPRTSRARLGRHELFGAMADVRFAELLRFAEGL